MTVAFFQCWHRKGPSAIKSPSGHFVPNKKKRYKKKVKPLIVLLPLSCSLAVSRGAQHKDTMSEKKVWKIMMCKGGQTFSLARNYQMRLPKGDHTRLVSAVKHLGIGRHIVLLLSSGEEGKGGCFLTLFVACHCCPSGHSDVGERRCWWWCGWTCPVVQRRGAWPGLLRQRRIERHHGTKTKQRIIADHESMTVTRHTASLAALNRVVVRAVISRVRRKATPTAYHFPLLTSMQHYSKRFFKIDASAPNLS